jgi:hypothetical protein
MIVPVLIAILSKLSECMANYKIFILLSQRLKIAYLLNSPPLIALSVASMMIGVNPD